MKRSHSILTVDSHTAGQATRIVVGGLPKIEGTSITDKKDYLSQRMDYVRTMLCNEPRGHSAMYGAILTEPGNRDTEFGVIFFSTIGYDDMCIHGSIGVATVLIEMGMVCPKEPSTSIKLETPAGLIDVSVSLDQGQVKSASVIGPPAFLFRENVPIEIPGYGRVVGDVAFGGNWYYYLRAEDVGIKVSPQNAADLIKFGLSAKDSLNKKLDLEHPANPDIAKKLLGVSIIDLSSLNDDTHQRNVVIESTFLDRSPCGTGTCGRMAVLHAHNKLSLNEEFINESITGSTFYGRLIAETNVGKYNAVVPEVTGSAYITGFNQLVVDSRDPFGPIGFLV